MNLFGKMLRKVRRSRDLSQQTCANAIGCSRGYICETEKGIQNPSYEKVKKLAKLLGEDENIFLIAAGHVPVELRHAAVLAPQRVTSEFHSFMYRIRGHREE